MMMMMMMMREKKMTENKRIKTSKERIKVKSMEERNSYLLNSNSSSLTYHGHLDTFDENGNGNGKKKQLYAPPSRPNSKANNSKRMITCLLFAPNLFKRVRRREECYYHYKRKNSFHYNHDEKENKKNKFPTTKVLLKNLILVTFCLLIYLTTTATLCYTKFTTNPSSSSALNIKENYNKKNDKPLVLTFPLPLQVATPTSGSSLESVQQTNPNEDIKLREKNLTFDNGDEQRGNRNDGQSSSSNSSSSSSSNGNSSRILNKKFRIKVTTGAVEQLPLDGQNSSKINQTLIDLGIDSIDFNEDSLLTNYMDELLATSIQQVADEEEEEEEDSSKQQPSSELLFAMEKKNNNNSKKEKKGEESKRVLVKQLKNLIVNNEAVAQKFQIKTKETIKGKVLFEDNIESSKEKHGDQQNKKTNNEHDKYRKTGMNFSNSNDVGTITTTTTTTSSSISEINADNNNNTNKNIIVDKLSPKRLSLLQRRQVQSEELPFINSANSNLSANSNISPRSTDLIGQPEGGEQPSDSLQNLSQNSTTTLPINNNNNNNNFDQQQQDQYVTCPPDYDDQTLLEVSNNNLTSEQQQQLFAGADSSGLLTPNNNGSSIDLESQNNRQQQQQQQQQQCYQSGSRMIEMITKVITPILFSIIIIVGLVGNIIVMLVILEDRKTERELTPTGLLILDLSLADLSFIIFCIPFTGWDYSVGHWVFGSLWCKFNQYLIVVCALSSIYTLVLMSVDRFMAIVYPIECMSYRTSKNTLNAIYIKWILILLMASPTISMHGLIDSPLGPDQYTCRFLADQYDPLQFQIIFFITSYLFPLILIFCLYLSLLNKLWFGTKPHGHKESIKTLESKKKVTWLVAGIVIVFALCWCPIQVMLILMRLKSHRITATYVAIQVFSHTLGYMNSCVNPIVYAFASESFLNSFKRSSLGRFCYRCLCLNNNHNINNAHHTNSDHDRSYNARNFTTINNHSLNYTSPQHLPNHPEQQQQQQQHLLYHKHNQACLQSIGLAGEGAASASIRNGSSLDEDSLYKTSAITSATNNGASINNNNNSSRIVSLPLEPRDRIILTPLNTAATTTTMQIQQHHQSNDNKIHNRSSYEPQAQDKAVTTTSPQLSSTQITNNTNIEATNNKTTKQQLVARVIQSSNQVSHKCEPSY